VGENFSAQQVDWQNVNVKPMGGDGINEPMAEKTMCDVDEGMTSGPSIFAYLVFGPGGTPVEEIARPMKLAIWRGPGARLGKQCKTRRRRPSQIRTRLGFIQTDSICNWLGEQSWDPTLAYKRLGGRSENLSRHFSPPSTRALVISRALHLRARSHLRLYCNQPL
jgi:hypothetical protein